jgi:hypothetical protein
MEISPQNSPVTPEHAAPPSDVTGKPTQTESERSVVRLAERLFAKAKRARAQFDKDWMQRMKYFRGDQWAQKRPQYRHSEVINLMQQSVRSAVAIITDPRPKVDCIPEDPTDFAFSQIMSQVIESKWERDNFQLVQAEILTDGCIIGTAISSVEQHDDLLDGLGDWVYESEDPSVHYPDPSARDVNGRRTLYWCKAEPVDVSLLRAEYPDKRHFIKPDLTDVSSFQGYTDEAQTFQFKSPTDNRVMVPDGKAYDTGNPDLVLKLTVLIKSMEADVNAPKDDKPATTESEPAQTPERTNEPPAPSGKIRKIVVASGALLCDEDLNYEDNKFPYARYVNNILPRQFWGDSDLEHLKSPQDIVNKTISYVLDYILMMGNPIWLVPTDSGVDTDNLTNEPSLVVEHKPNAKPTREQGVNLPPFISNFLQFVYADVYGKVSGNKDVSQGAVDKSNLSGEAISQLIEANQTQLRQKQRFLEAYNQEVGQLMVSRILQFYAAPRIIVLTGRDDAKQYFKFNINVKQNEQGKTYRTATIQKYSMPVEGQSGGGWQEPQEVELKSRLDIRISSGSSLPLQKARDEQRAERLFDKGVFDAEDLLNAYQLPGKEKVIQKYNERQAALAKAKEQELAMKSGGAPVGV